VRSNAPSVAFQTALIVLCWSAHLSSADRTFTKVYEPIETTSACFKRLNATQEICCRCEHLILLLFTIKTKISSLSFPFKFNHSFISSSFQLCSLEMWGFCTWWMMKSHWKRVLTPLTFPCFTKSILQLTLAVQTKTLVSCASLQNRLMLRRMRKRVMRFFLFDVQDFTTPQAQSNVKSGTNQEATFSSKTSTFPSYHPTLFDIKVDPTGKPPCATPPPVENTRWLDSSSFVEPTSTPRPSLVTPPSTLQSTGGILTRCSFCWKMGRILNPYNQLIIACLVWN